MQLLIANKAGPAEAKAPIAWRPFGKPDQRMPIQLDQTLPFAPPDRHGKALPRHKQIQRLNPLDGKLQGIVAAQIVELGVIFAFDRRHPQRLTLAVGFGFLALGAAQRGKPLQRCGVQIVVIGMHAIAVALQAAAHGAQKRAKLVADTVFQKRP